MAAAILSTYIMLCIYSSCINVVPVARDKVGGEEHRPRVWVQGCASVKSLFTVHWLTNSTHITLEPRPLEVGF